jgi:hypothetical protein
MDETQVDPAPLEGFRLLRRGHHKTGKPSFGIAPKVLQHNRRKVMKGGACFKSDGERLCTPVTRISRRFHGAVVMTQRFARALGEKLAGRREGNRASRALDQRRAHESFEGLDLTCKSRLRNSNLLCRSAKVEFIGERGKIP